MPLHDNVIAGIANLGAIVSMSNGTGNFIFANDASRCVATYRSSSLLFQLNKRSNGFEEQDAVNSRAVGLSGCTAGNLLWRVK